MGCWGGAMSMNREENAKRQCSLGMSVAEWEGETLFRSPQPPDLTPDDLRWS